MSKIDLKDIVTFTNNGVSSATYMEIVEAYREAMQKLYGNDIDISDASADGQYIMEQSLALYNMGGVISALYKNLNPFIATGKYLDMICSWSNIYRKSATSAVCHLIVSVAEGFSLNKGIGEYLIYNSLDGTTWSNNYGMEITGPTNVPYVNTNGVLTIDGDTENYYYGEEVNSNMTYTPISEFITNKGEVESVTNVNSQIVLNNLYGLYTPNSNNDGYDPVEFKPLNVIEFECTSTGADTNNSSVISYEIDDLPRSIPLLNVDNTGPVSSMIDVNSSYMFWQIDDAVGGANDESDEELRTRRFITNYGKSTVNNLKTALMSIYGVRDAYIINNNNSTSLVIDKDSLNADISVNPYSTYIAIRTYSNLSVDYDEVSKIIYNNLPFGASTILSINNTDLDEDTDTKNNGSIKVREISSIIGSGDTSENIKNTIMFKTNSYLEVLYEGVVIYVSNDLDTDYVLNRINYELEEIIDNVIFGEQYSYREGIAESIANTGLNVKLSTAVGQLNNTPVNIYEGIYTVDFVIPKTSYLKFRKFTQINKNSSVTEIQGYTAYTLA